MREQQHAFTGVRNMNAVASLFKTSSGRSRSYSDIVLVFGVVAIVALMILPLPMAVIDTLVAINILVGIGLLLIAIYIPTPVAFSSFPSVLMLTTLFRLALSIAITRSILLHADAGHIIDTFGNVVVSGNLVVGLVVFLIITVVQFIVVAKGAERVAEVAARFSLDAMPGKQLSIDSDLRSGILDKDEAKRKRRLLEIESQLHGSLDGAMKFVKGDAIAGLVITMINILAGIVIGVTFHGMTAADAANRFAILSIGDAMVSQIPSLLICVASGVMSTRVGDEHAAKPKSLGAEIASQLGNSPQALYLAAGLLCGFALVPGFPWHVFLLIAITLTMVGRQLAKIGPDGHKDGGLKGLQRDGGKIDGAKPHQAVGIESAASAFSCPLAVTVSPSLGTSLRSEALNSAFERERTSLSEQLGLPFPGIRLWTKVDHPDGAYEILLHDVPSGSGTLQAGKLMLIPPSEALGGAQPAGPAGGELQTYWIDASAAAEAANAQAQALSHESVIARHVVGVLHEQAHQFLGIQEVQWILERVGTDYPGLVAEAQKVVPLQRISEVLRRLLEEQLPIRNMRAICESLIVWGPKEKDVLMLTEYVRGDLGRYLSHRATGGSGSLSAVLLDAGLEKMIRESIKPTPAGNFLALAPDVMTALATNISDIAGEQRPGLAVVTSMDIRRYVRRIVEAETKWLPVYSFQELGTHVRLEPLGRVTM